MPIDKIVSKIRLYMLINTNLCITTTNPLLRYRFKLRPSYCKSAKAIHIVLPLS